MKRSIKNVVFLDRFYKRHCCGAANHPESWKKEKRLTQKSIRRKLKQSIKEEEDTDGKG